MSTPATHWSEDVDWDHIVREYDADGNGSLSSHEFTCFIQDILSLSTRRRLSYEEAVQDATNLASSPAWGPFITE
jgi:Ca2+-binding EF-hand superfamily protein